ncbi:MAG: restriction endonuclease [Bacteroidetes bacterium]|nr:restriction endonuclease [Bacteroidota bacterium]
MRERRKLFTSSKQTKSLVGNAKIQEIYTAKNYYDEKFNEKFKLLVISNSDFSSPAETLARTNQVNLIRRNQFDKLISENDVPIQEVNKHESQRMKNIAIRKDKTQTNSKAFFKRVFFSPLQKEIQIIFLPPFSKRDLYYLQANKYLLTFSKRKLPYNFTKTESSNFCSSGPHTF